MKPLINAMVRNNPAKRPTMDAVLDHFALIQGSLSIFNLRCRVSDKKEWAIVCVAQEIIHWTRQLYHIAQGIPPLGRIDKSPVEDEGSDSDLDRLGSGLRVGSRPSAKLVAQMCGQLSCSERSFYFVTDVADTDHLSENSTLSFPLLRSHQA